jgi:hypothetical protein
VGHGGPGVVQPNGRECSKYAKYEWFTYLP